jgi:positive regulator of sigma E activity
MNGTTDVYEGVVCAREQGSVEVEVSEGRCAGCVHACGRVRVRCRDEHAQDLAIGEKVALRVPRAAVHRAAWCAFGIPLAGLLVGACVVAPLIVPDAGEAGAAAAGMLAALVGGAVGRRIAGRERQWIALTAIAK